MITSSSKTLLRVMSHFLKTTSRISNQAEQCIVFLTQVEPVDKSSTILGKKHTHVEKIKK